MSDENPKIIIDEGWKSKVEREKQQAEKQADSPQDQALDHEKPLEGDPNFTLFDSLTSGLAAQTMVALGLAGEQGEQVQVDLPYAHHLISSLVMLQQKTAGHLEEAEAANLEEAIGELTRVFSVREDQIRELDTKQQTEAKPDLRILEND